MVGEGEGGREGQGLGSGAWRKKGEGGEQREDRKRFVNVEGQGPGPRRGVEQSDVGEGGSSRSAAFGGETDTTMAREQLD